jgi:hypothetical protein
VGVMGQVTVGQAVGAPVTVTLTSSAPAIINVPSTVTLPAGATTVAFPLTLRENETIEGNATAAVTATVQGWTAGSASTLLQDDESTTLVLKLPPFIGEPDGTLTGIATVGLDGRTTAAVTISLTSSDVTELTVPSTVVVPAGARSVDLPLTAIQDAEGDGPQEITITATASNFVGIADTLLVQDDDRLLGVPFAPRPALAEAHASQDSDLAWGFGDGNLIGNGGFEAPVITVPETEATLGNWELLSGSSAGIVGSDQAVAGNSALRLSPGAEVWQQVAIPVDGPVPLLRWMSLATAMNAAVEVRADGRSILSAPLTVRISARGRPEILPVLVVIPADEVSALFSLTAMDDTELDGSQSVTVMAEAVEHLLGTATGLTVDDNESAVLSIVALARMPEGRSDTGIVRVSAPVAADVRVRLVRSLPEAFTAPTEVVIPAGATEVSFPFTSVNDTVIRRNRLVLLSASVPRDGRQARLPSCWRMMNPRR